LAEPAETEGVGMSGRYHPLLEDVLARIVAAREAADPCERDQILFDLEADAVGWLEQELPRAA
jgi:hypothetical protein